VLSIRREDKKKICQPEGQYASARVTEKRGDAEALVGRLITGRAPKESDCHTFL